jgi:divalent metal cation (Fe/Co/Zn/Cd) transporter
MTQGCTVRIIEVHLEFEPNIALVKNHSCFQLVKSNLLSNLRIGKNLLI